MRLVFEAAPTPTPQQPLLPPLPRVSLPPSAGPQHIPVAHQTWAHLAALQLSSLVELVQYHVPTAKTTRPQATMLNHFASLCKALALSKPEVIEFAGLCKSLTILNDGDALTVLDRNTGKLLKHCQLRKDPCYKMVWDRSYANKLGRLCQGVGTGDKAGGKRVAGTNTFHLIAYADIPHQKQKQIIYTKVVCEVRKGKDDENLTRITVGG
jgi:hypothetical protein